MAPNLGYIEPITFRFGGSEIISGEVQETAPEPLADTPHLITVKPDAIELAGVLLNRRDSITIKVLLTGLKGEVKARGRIVDAQFIAANKTKR